MKVAHMSMLLVQRLFPPLQLFNHLFFLRNLEALLVTFKREVFNSVAPMMRLGIFQIRHKIVHIEIIGLE